jgi:hypothetical protein
MAFLTPTAALIAALLASLVHGPLADQVQRTASEQDLKAAFLYNFTRFVNWPDGIPPGAEPFRLCIIADRETTTAVERTMAGESVNGRPAETRVPRSPEDTRNCQVLFVGRETEERAKPFLASVRDQPVLLVGDGEQFTARGGAIQFVLVDGKLRFDIHARNAARGGLTISSRLLSLARQTDQGRR